MRIHSCSKYLNKNTKNSLTIWYTRDWCMSGMLKPWSWPISVKEVFSGLKEASYLMELIAQLVINISTPRLRWQADYTRSPIAWISDTKTSWAARRWWCDQSSGRYEEQSSIGLRGKKLGVGGGVLICSELAQGEGNSFLSPSRCTRGHKIPGYIKVLSSTKSLPLQTFQTFRVRRSGWHPQLSPCWD